MIVSPREKKNTKKDSSLLSHYQNTCMLFSNAPLPFMWQFYRPFTRPSEFESLNSETENSTQDNLETSKQCQFHISPASGILPPGKPTAFVAQFYPKQVSKNVQVVNS